MPNLKGNIAILDPSEKHYYQPLWTLVGGGEVKKETTERGQSSLIPEGVKWIKESAARFELEENKVITSAGTVIQYDYMAIAAGIQINWDKVKGLKDSLGKDGVCSNYAYEYVNSTWESIQSFKGGTAIFTHPKLMPQFIPLLKNIVLGIEFISKFMKDQESVQFMMNELEPIVWRVKEAG